MNLNLASWLKNTPMFVICICLSLTTYSQQFEWGIPTGAGMLRSLASKRSNAVCTDKFGNTYVVGTFDAVQDFDPGPGLSLLAPIASGKINIFIAKYDLQGVHQWSKCIASTSSGTGVSLSATGITIDNFGEITIKGEFDATMYFHTSQGIDSIACPKASRKHSSALFLIKYNDAGDYLWTKSILPYFYNGIISSSIYSNPNIIADNVGNLYVSGYFEGGFDFDPGAGQFEVKQGELNVRYGFVARYSSGGDLIWAKAIGADSNTSSSYEVMLWDIVVDTLNGLNDVVLVGDFRGIVDFDPGPGQSTLSSINGGVDVFLQKLDSNGAFKWVKPIGGSDVDGVTMLRLSKFRNIYLSGSTYSVDADFDPGVDTSILSHKGFVDYYIAKYDINGDFEWVRGISDTGAAASHPLIFVLDDYENLYCTGEFTDGFFFSSGIDGVQFDPISNSNKLLFDPMIPQRIIRMFNFIAKYDACGNYKWAEKFEGSEGVNFKSGISMYPTAIDTVAIFVAGEKRKTVDPIYLFTDFDPGPDTFQFENWPDDYMNFLINMKFALPVSTLDVAICDDGYTFGDSTYTESGTYFCQVGLPESCDSVVVLTLDLTPPIQQPMITVNERILGVTLSYTTYQWYLNEQEIVGATDSVYNVLENGHYTVVVTNEVGCVDTSEIYTVTNVGINNPKGPAPLLVYPNPVRDHIYIDSRIPVTIIITDVAGRRIKSVEAAKSLRVADFTPGVYLVELRNHAGQLIQVNRVVKM